MEEEKEKGVDTSMHLNSDSFHYIGDNPFIQDMSGPFAPTINPNGPFNPNQILPGGGLINPPKSSVEVALEAANEKIMSLQYQIHLMNETIAMMNDKINKHLKYERRSIGSERTTVSGKPDDVQEFQRKGTGSDAETVQSGEPSNS